MRGVHICKPDYFRVYDNVIKPIVEATAIAVAAVLLVIALVRDVGVVTVT